MKDEKGKICKIFTEFTHFVVTSHQNVDGDGLGSALALSFLLKRMGKESSVVYDGRVPYFYLFLPGARDVLSFDDFLTHDQFPEVLVVVDCSNPTRLGKVEELLRNVRCVVNVDHHPDNTLFGHVNFVVPLSPASALLVYELARKLDISLDVDIATNILTGIVTDTGGFQFAELNQLMFTVVGELVASGASLSTIMRHVFRYRRLEALRLLSRALDRLTFDPSCRCAVMHLTRKDFQECGAGEEDAEGIVDYGLYIPDAEVSVFLKEIEHEVYKVSLRSRENFDVLLVARHFGGGGHRKAAGFKMTGSLSSIYGMVLDYIRSLACHESGAVVGEQKEC